ncbi:uncharacterized protein [Rutidosis leptorrhynchoides]|uniref:uncharacterized protein n=1 Tax=Rutidosis leptorrhynchoides TaxID=125765 RepID=UPI003A9925FD
MDVTFQINSVSITPDKPDSWRWALNSSGLFTTRKLTTLIDEKLLLGETNRIETLRNCLVPKKVEVFVWKARKRRIPTLIELDKRGIYLHSVRCPVCDDDVETVEHSLIFCKLAHDIWQKVFDWWGLGGVSNLSIGEIFRGTSNQPMSSLRGQIWQPVE